MRLIVEHLAQGRGERLLIDDLSFEVASGEAVILTGPNGAGKTTLLRTLAGLAPPRAGSIRLDGGGPDASVGEHAHWIGHTNAIKAALTVSENARFWAAFLGGGDSVDTALRDLDLIDLADVPAGYLSAGQQRRLGIARLLLAVRPLWLLDEPTVSLDAANRDRLARLMHRHLDGGGMIIAATHLDLGLKGARTIDLSACDPSAVQQPPALQAKMPPQNPHPQSSGPRR